MLSPKYVISVSLTLRPSIYVKMQPVQLVVMRAVHSSRQIFCEVTNQVTDFKS